MPQEELENKLKEVENRLLSEKEETLVCKVENENN